ncbi:diacylglycerol/lipid kinase family protein, partial [Staphylococcus pseudintermedius]|uniref:diacylglycerol/lipid kinase family protein n=1 Tax=Staphylococcus pseudintermedius TaxID=283734 RepID=UPI00237BE353
FILGGDGTVNELINGVMTHDLQLPIGILPGGTFNDFTKTLNIAPNHKQASEQMISAQVGTYDVIKINNQYALNFVGLGLIVQNAENVQDGSKDIFGKLSYIGSTVKTLLKRKAGEEKKSREKEKGRERGGRGGREKKKKHRKRRRTEGKKNRKKKGQREQTQKKNHTRQTERVHITHICPHVHVHSHYN